MSVESALNSENALQLHNSKEFKIIPMNNTNQENITLITALDRHNSIDSHNKNTLSPIRAIRKLINEKKKCQ